MGSFHAAWACPRWVFFPHRLDSAQHPIAHHASQGEVRYELDAGAEFGTLAFACLGIAEGLFLSKEELGEFGSCGYVVGVQVASWQLMDVKREV